MKINDQKITAKTFAYDGCHKIYLLENDEQVCEAKALGYNTLPIAEIEQAYEDSCGLRFIQYWSLDRECVPQFEDAKFN